jgi:hypothetical protein
MSDLWDKKSQAVILSRNAFYKDLLSVYFALANFLPLRIVAPS